MSARGIYAVVWALIMFTLTAAPSEAEPTGAAPPPSPLSAVPGAMWQTDKTVWSMAYSQGVLYVGGSFANVRPPGAAPGTSLTAQARLAAFDATTGEFISSWRPTIGGGDVFSLAVSPDGTRLYVGGGFTAVNGSKRTRIAAFDITAPRSPVLVAPSGFSASANAKVVDIDATNTAVYVGGNFTIAGGQSRPYVAAFAAQGTGVTSFRVDLSGVSAPSYTKPFVTAVEHNAGRILVGGLFDNVNGVAQHGIAMVDAQTGQSTPGFAEPSLINTSYVTAATFDSGRLFISGRDDKSGKTTRLEGVMALDADTGSILWGSDQHRCLGDSFALQVLHGAVWVATHAHDCSKVGTFPESNPRFYGAVLGQQVASGEQAHFYPETFGRSTVPGSLNNTRAFATDGQRLFVGGGFLSVNGMPQQNLTAFSPKVSGGAAPVRVARPTVTASAGGGAKVSWTASSDRDDRSLTYEVFRRNSTTPFTTLEATSSFWKTPTLSVVDTAVSEGESVFYKVRVSDGTNRSMSLTSATFTVPPAPTTYRAAVMASGPAMYWTLDDAAGSGVLADASGRGDTGTVSGQVALNQNGALSDSTNRAGTFPGDSHVYSSVARTNPSSFSMELWFRTTSQTGGKLIGLGNAKTGTSTQYDRHLYLTDDGRVVFGVYTGAAVVLANTSALNDNSWHHVVATQDAAGMALYVDGVLVASNTQPAAENYVGYIRVGGDNLNGWPFKPTSSRFAGGIDEVAYYTQALTGDEVAQHFGLR